ncbi:hypothetical protein PN36_04275 [Candidatus Thiomargarita nelsonii]|uniref:Uncharacterized protein n=1 Tax=Candidatus Thiomargarita nelsonii TaxID=1003181 RepID=A0A0A6PJ95_9GAMM|nr:hypothetical protein PN36_04275 [Candidatus Thiomargarita nelsonii]
MLPLINMPPRGGISQSLKTSQALRSTQKKSHLGSRFIDFFLSLLLEAYNFTIKIRSQAFFIFVPI